MNEERLKILEMLSQGKITVAEADSLLGALGEKTPDGVTPSKRPPVKDPKFLRVEVVSNEKGKETVNVRVPFQLLKSGIKLAALIPIEIRDKVNLALEAQGVSVDLSKIRPENLESLVTDLADMWVDVDNGTERVRVYCE